MPHRPEIVAAAPFEVACIPFTIDPAEMRNVMRPALTELHDALAKQHIAVHSPWLTHHWRRPDPSFNFDICLPIGRRIASVGRVRPGVIAAHRIIRTDYFGDYSGLPLAWGAFIDEIKHGGHAIRQDFWEIYIVGPDASPDPTQWRTQLVCPLEPLAPH
jgi:effector-binding domain-containing protein